MCYFGYLSLKYQYRSAIVLLISSFIVESTEEENSFNNDVYTVGDIMYYMGPQKAGILGKQWPQGKINYYVLDKNLPNDQQLLVRKATKLLESKSCIRFKEYSSESELLTEKSSIKFISNPEECSSFVGYQGDNPQIINIQTPQCGLGQYGDIAHEIMHTLGFYHEHGRKDRDNFVWINESNVAPEYGMNNFDKNKDPSYYFDVPYNFDSMMHYGPWLAAKKPATIAINAKGDFTWDPKAKPDDRTIAVLEPPKGEYWGDPNNMGLMTLKNIISQGDELMLERMYWNECNISFS